MKICRNCLYHSAHPLNISFDLEGVCSGCRVHEEKNMLDWRDRTENLRRICDEYRSRSGKSYDCIVPVSGGRDSYFIVHMVKNVFGMNPLLVTYNKHYNTAVGVRNLANLRIQFDADLITMTVHPEKVKRITRGTLRRLGSVYWHCIAGQTVFPVQMAVRLKIPLIIWGAHQGVDQVGMFSHLDEVEMTRRYRHEHDLMGYEAEDLVDEFDGISYLDVEPFIYPDNRELDLVGVRGVYMNNFVRWDSKTQHEEMIRRFGYETASQSRTYDCYNDVDCWLYSDLHDFLKWLKHGYGKVVDHAVREIRLGHMSRQMGARLVMRYLGVMPRGLEKFLAWIGMTKNAFGFVTDQIRNPLFWERNSEWEWRETGLLVRQYESIAQSTTSVESELRGAGFRLSGVNDSTDDDEAFILVGRGFGS